MSVEQHIPDAGSLPTWTVPAYGSAAVIAEQPGVAVTVRVRRPMMEGATLPEERMSSLVSLRQS
jgi:hypothetical protein